MKNTLLTMLTAGSIALISGCSTIVFTNDNQASSETYGVWHHNVAYSLYELSEPLDPNHYCDAGWAKVTVEKDLITAIAGSVDEAVTFGGVDLWDPWAVTINCAK